MTTIQGLLVFLGIPLTIVGLIFAAVYATATRDRRPAPPGPPVGTSVAPNPARSMPTTASSDTRWRRRQRAEMLDAGRRRVPHALRGAPLRSALHRP